MENDFEDCQQAEKAQITECPISDGERRRFIALDHAVRISNGSGDAGAIIRTARAFENYLRGGDVTASGNDPTITITGTPEAA